MSFMPCYGAKVKHPRAKRKKKVQLLPKKRKKLKAKRKLQEKERATSERLISIC